MDKPKQKIDEKPTQIISDRRWDYSCPWCDSNIHDKVYKSLSDKWQSDPSQETIQTTCPHCGNKIEADVLLTPEFGFRRQEPTS